jgi:O-antigen/teichoic acid export membrane protein
MLLAAERRGSAQRPRAGRKPVTFARNVSITFAARIVILLASLATSIVMARALGPTGKGLFSLAVLVSGLVFMALNLGVGTASGYFLGRKKVPLEELAGNWLSLSVVIGLGALAVSLALAPGIVPRFVPSVPLWAVVLSLFSVPFAILLGNFLLLFRANDDFRSFNVVDAMQPVLFCLFFAACALFESSRLFEASIVVWLVSYAATGLGAVLLMRKFVKVSFRWNRALVRETLRFGVQQNLGNLLDFLNYRFDMLLVNWFLDPAHVGYYSISVVVVEKMWYVPNVLSAVLHPRVAHAGDEGEATRATAVVTRVTVLVIAAGCVAILLLGRPLVRLLYSSRFLPAVTPLFILLPGIVMISIAKVLTSDLSARGYPRASMLSGLIAVVSNIAANLVLIPRFGLNGAALSSTISYTLCAVVLVAYFRRVTGVSLAALVVPTAADARYLARIVARELGRVLPARRTQPPAE